MAEHYETADEWYDALITIAGSHCVTHLVRDREAWTSNWQNETPEKAFYTEYPEYYEDEL